MRPLTKPGERRSEDSVPGLGQEVGDTAPTPATVPGAVHQNERLVFGHSGSHWLVPFHLLTALRDLRRARGNKVPVPHCGIQRSSSRAATSIASASTVAPRSAPRSDDAEGFG